MSREECVLDDGELDFAKLAFIMCVCVHLKVANHFLNFDIVFVFLVI